MKFNSPVTSMVTLGAFTTKAIQNDKNGLKEQEISMACYACRSANE